MWVFFLLACGPFSFSEGELQIGGEDGVGLSKKGVAIGGIEIGKDGTVGIGGKTFKVTKKEICHKGACVPMETLKKLKGVEQMDRMEQIDAVKDLSPEEKKALLALVRKMSKK